MLVLDTSTRPTRDRRDALDAAISATEVPAEVSITNQIGEAHHRIDAWSLGTGAHILRTVGTGFGIRRGPKELRISAPERVCVALQLGSPARWDSIAGLRAIQPGELQLVDQTSGSQYRFDNEGGAASIAFDYDRLGVSVDAVRAAIPLLSSSPVYELFRTDLAYACQVLTDSDDLSTTSHIGASLESLATALIATATGSPGTRSDALEDVFVRRVQHHKDTHLNDPTLGDESIATFFGTSIRELRRRWASREESTREYVRRRRLDEVRTELGARMHDPGELELVLRRWGFGDVGGLREEFLLRFGVGPKEWGPSEFGSNVHHRGP